MKKEGSYYNMGTNQQGVIRGYIFVMEWLHPNSLHRLQLHKFT